MWINQWGRHVLTMTCGYHYANEYLDQIIHQASLMAQLVKNLLAMQETLAWFLGQEEPLEKGKATHSSILAWRIPWTCIVHGVAKSQTQLSDFSLYTYLVPNLEEIISWGLITLPGRNLRHHLTQD